MERAIHSDLDLLDNFEVQLHLAAAAGGGGGEGGSMNQAVSFASCPLMAYLITRTPVLHRTCAQEAWTYFGYTTETGYALLANLGSLSCPQPLGTNTGVPLMRTIFSPLGYTY